MTRWKVDSKNSEYPSVTDACISTIRKQGACRPFFFSRHHGQRIVDSGEISGLARD